MLIFAMDTSCRIASVALCRDGQVLAVGEKDSQMNHSRTILPVAQQLLEQQGLSLGDVDVFAATVGPGSFTGVRIGVAAIKGYAWAGGKPCAGVSSLESAAWSAQERNGLVCAAIKARQDEFFYSLFRCAAGQPPQRLCPDQVATAGEIAQLLAQESGPVYLAGDGAADLLALCPEEAQLIVTDCRQNGGATALCAHQMAQGGQLTDCHGLTPTYLRLSQAEQMKQKAEQNQSKEDLQ